MKVIKNYTDIEQSKKLSEFLSLESADMNYSNMCYKGVMYSNPYSAGLSSYNDASKANQENIDFYLKGVDYKGVIAWDVLPCWSLTALLNIMPKDKSIECSISFGYYNGKGEYIEKWLCAFEKEGETTDDYIIETFDGNNPVDACVEMIEKLHKLKLL